MFCKICGKEIADDSKFCNFCGSEQQSATAISENSPSTEDEKTNKTLWAIFGGCLIGGCLIFVFIIVLIIVGATNGDSSTKTNPSYSNSSSTQGTTRSAKTSDLVITFKKIDNYFAYDDFYMIIQAQEKITNLKLSIDYTTSSGKIVKTKIINVGKVVPGNEYKFELDQSGIDWDYLDKVSKFSYSIVSGTVEE